MKIPHRLPRKTAAFPRTMGLRIFLHLPRKQNDLYQTLLKAVSQRGGALEQVDSVERQAFVKVKLSETENTFLWALGRHPHSPHEQESKAVKQSPSWNDVMTPSSFLLGSSCCKALGFNP